MSPLALPKTAPTLAQIFKRVGVGISSAGRMYSRRLKKGIINDSWIMSDAAQELRLLEFTLATVPEDNVGDEILCQHSQGPLLVGAAELAGVGLRRVRVRGGRGGE